MDYYSIRRIVLSVMSLSACACFVIANTHSWIIAMLMRSIQGLASAASLLTCVRLAINWFRNNANAAIGLMIAFALLGGVFSNYLFIHIIRLVGWRVGLNIIGLLGFFILFILFYYLFDNKYESYPTHLINPAIILQSLKEILNNYRNLLLGLYLGLMSLPLFILASLWGNLYLQQVYRMQDVQAGFTTSLLFIGLIIGSPLIGFIADKLRKPKWLLLAGPVLALIVFIPFSLNIRLSASNIMLFILLLGIISSIQNITYTVIAEFNIDQAMSSATGFVALILNIVGACGQLLFGSLLNVSWQNLAFAERGVVSDYYANAVLIFPSAFIICILLIWLCFKKYLQ